MIGATVYLDVGNSLEAFPDVFLLFWREARPMISYGNLDLICLSLQAHLDRLIFMRVLQSIGEIVHEYLRDAVRVGIYGCCLYVSLVQYYGSVRPDMLLFFNRLTDNR